MKSDNKPKDFAVVANSIVGEDESVKFRGVINIEEGATVIVDDGDDNFEVELDNRGDNEDDGLDAVESFTDTLILFRLAFKDKERAAEDDAASGDDSITTTLLINLVWLMFHFSGDTFTRNLAFV